MSSLLTGMQATDLRTAERNWHDEFYRRQQRRDFLVPRSIQNRYLNPPPEPAFHLEQMFRLIGDVRGKRVLYFGCGDDNSTILLALKGAEVWAFDISVEAVQLQRNMALANAVANNLRLFVCSGDELPLRDHAFDLVFGAAVLYHLPDRLAAVSQELFRITRKEGFAIFSEPFLRSRLLRCLRRMAPVATVVSPGERPLTDDDLAPFRRHFCVHTFPFHLLARLDRWLCRGRLEEMPQWRRAAVLFVHKMDRWLLRMPFMARFAGVLVLKMEPLGGMAPSRVAG